MCTSQVATSEELDVDFAGYPCCYSAWQVTGGAKGSRTPDLLNAIQALSQLSYGPTRDAGWETASGTDDGL